jgi:hypothetical protein
MAPNIRISHFLIKRICPKGFRLNNPIMIQYKMLANLRKVSNYNTFLIISLSSLNIIAVAPQTKCSLT